MTPTPDHILALPPGRELDALAAELVLGWQRTRCPLHADCQEAGFKPGATRASHFPHCSTDIAAADTLVDALLERGCVIEQESFRYSNGHPTHAVTVWGEHGKQESSWAHVEDDPRPLAITKAALLAALALREDAQ